MKPFYLVVDTYLRLLMVPGISHFGAKCALALLSESAAALMALILPAPAVKIGRPKRLYL